MSVHDRHHDRSLGPPVISSVEVIADAIFVVFQLQQSARLIRTTNFETKANMSFSVHKKVTEESFARRRKNMNDAVKKYIQINWEGFDDSLEDLRRETLVTSTSSSENW